MLRANGMPSAEADGGKSIVELCREKNLSEQTFHRCKSKFGLMEIPASPSILCRFTTRRFG